MEILMNSWFHAQSAAKKWGGTPEDYLPVEEFIDSSKQVIGDARHRSLYHHTLGVFLCERIFGKTLTIGRKKIPADELQQVVDYYADREFAGFIEVRNSSSSQAPVARYHVRGRRVETVTPTLVWPGEDAQPVSAAARQQIAAELEAHAESIGWYEGGGVWAEALDVIRREPWTRGETGGDNA